MSGVVEQDVIAKFKGCTTADRGENRMFSKAETEVVIGYLTALEAENASLREDVARMEMERMIIPMVEAGPVEFLLDRLDDFERGLECGSCANEFWGHVSPAMARTRAALSPTQTGGER